MDTLLIASLIVDLIAFGLAMRLLYKTRDWRLSFLAATSAFFVVHQWGALNFAGNLSATTHSAFRFSELTDSLASVMVLLSIFFVGRLIQNERERTAELRVSEARYRSLFDDAPVMLHSADRNGRLLDVNRHWLKVMGFARDEVIGTDIKDYLAENTRQHAVEVSLPAFYRSGSASEVPYSLTNKAGDRVEVLASSTAENDEHGAFGSSRSAMVDVTEQREAETLLLESLESSPDSIAIFDSRDRLKLYNDAFEASVLSNVAGRVELNMQFEELLRSLVNENLIVIPEGDVDGYIRARLEHHRLGNSSIEVELTDGRWFTIKERRMPGGGTVSTRSDITERKRTELALQENEQRMRNIIESVPGFVYQRVLHVDGSVTFPFLSAHYKEALGIDPQAVVEDPQVILRRVHPDDLEGWMAAWQESAKSLAPFDHELRISRAPNDYRWYRVRATPRRLPNGDTLWDALGVDITELKQRQEALNDSEAKFRQLAQGSIVGVHIHRNFKTLVANQAYADIFGYASPEEIGALTSVVPLIAPHERERLEDYRKRRVAGEKVPEQYEYQGVRKDGEVIWLESHVRIVDWEGEPANQTTLIDITERKHAEQALKDSEKRLRSMIENVPGVVYRRIQHADGSVTFPFVSKHYKGALGIDPNEAVENPQVILDKLHDEDRDEWMAAWRKSAKSSTPFNREVRIFRSKKDIRWFRIRALPQRLPNGETMWDAIGIDVTEEKRATEVRDRAFAAIENLTEGVALFGPDDRLVYTNPRYVEFNEKGGSGITLGKTFEQIVRRNVRLGRVPEAIGREKEWIAERMAAHRNRPYAAERKVGNRWFDIREAALPDGSTVLLNIDIAERRRAHAALAESEARLRLLSDALPVGINYLDTDLRYRFANKAYCTWHGIDPDEIIGKSTREVLGAKAIKVMTPSVKAALAGENVNFEARVSYKKAGERDVQIIAVPHANDSGEIIGTYGLVLDITEQKRASEVRDRAFAALENLSEGVALFAPDDTLVFANQRFVELNEEAGPFIEPGQSFEEIVRKSVALDRFPEAAGREKKWIKERLEAHRNPPFAAERRVGKGWQEIREEALPDGSVIYLVNDITQRKKTAETIRKNEQQLSLITENVPAMIGHFGRDERFRFANSAYKKALGFSPKKMIGMSLREVWGDEIYATIADKVKRVLNGETVKFENELLGTDGRRRNVAATYVPHVVNGAVEAFFSLAIDITQQVTTQQALRAHDERLHQLQSELLRVNRAATIGQFSSSLTHEIKQPLAAATFYMQAIQQLIKKNGQKTGNEISEIIGKVGDQVGRAAAVVGRLRPLLERGEVERKEADINEVVEDAVAVAGLELDRKNIDLRTILGRGLPRVSVDTIQVQQVLLNLVRNGVEATRNSKRQELTVKTRATKGGEIEVSISDTGRGIPVKLRKSVFDPFVTTRAGGTGMGLSVSRTIVEAHGGRIWASPRRGGGTIMHFTLGLAA